VLASSSPRRFELLRLLGLTFRTDVSAVDEILDGTGEPAEIGCQLALAKARAVMHRHQGETILAADTLILFRGRLLGKPRDSDDAEAMLRALRGRWHRVLTGVAVIHGTAGTEFVGCEETRVLMRRYSDAEIERYVASGDPLDKAAAYAIQNPSFHPVARLKGCYSNVMGLPLCSVVELLTEAGLAIPARGTRLRTARCEYCLQAQKGSAPAERVTPQSSDSSL